MKIKEITLNSFGRFTNERLPFTDHLNVIYGDNEKGKSTITSFLTSTLFMEDVFRKKKDFTYLPFGKAECFGEMVCEHDGEKYIFKPNFLAKKLNALNFETKASLDKNKLPFSFGPGKDQTSPGYGLFKVSYPVFKETFLVNQKSFFDLRNLKKEEIQTRQSALSETLREVARSGSSNLRVEKVLDEFLKEMKKISTNADFTNLYKSGEIGEINIQISNLEEKYRELKNRQDEIIRHKSDATNREKELNKLKLREIELNKEYETNVRRRNSFLRKKLDSDNKTNKEAFLNDILKATQIEDEKPKKIRKTKIIFSLLIVLSLISFPFLGFINSWLFLLSILGVVVSIGFLIALFKLTKNIASRKNDIFLKYQVNSLEELKTKAETKEDMSFLKSQILEEYGYDEGKYSEEEFVKVDKELQRIRLDVTSLESSINAEHGILRLENVQDELLVHQNRISDLKKQKEELVKKYKTYALAYDVLSKEAKTLFEENIPILRNKLNFYKKQMMTNDLEVIVNDDYLVDVQNKLGEVVTDDKISTGTYAEFYLALRLALIDLIDPSELVPIIFDDAFLEFDYSRLTNTLKLLANLKRQIIILTHSYREQEILTKLKIEHEYKDLNKI